MTDPTDPVPDAPTGALAHIGDLDPFLFLARDEVVVPAGPDEVFALVEGDHQRRFLAALSPRFEHRDVTATFDDGYLATTVAARRLGRHTRYDSAHWVDPGRRSSMERQTGTRTDVLYEHAFRPDAGGTRVSCSQSFVARSAGFESGAAITQLQRRAVEIVASRVAAVAALVADRA